MAHSAPAHDEAAQAGQCGAPQLRALPITALITGCEAHALHGYLLPLRRDQLALVQRLGG